MSTGTRGGDGGGGGWRREGYRGGDFAANGRPAEPDIRAMPEVPPAADAELSLKQRLGQWWGSVAARELESVLPKIEEYGATDLRVLGAAMRPLVPRAAVSDEELAIAFYAYGKLSRIIGAISDGRRPSDDCWHDLGVYARMAQRVRETGDWP